MRNAKRDDVVTCDKLDMGDFKVVNVIDNGPMTVLQIVGLQFPKAIHFVAEHSCELKGKK